MDIKQLLNKLQNSIKTFPARFKAMGLGEQLAYGAIVLGFLLILIAIILF